MTVAMVDGTSIAYEVIGERREGGRFWSITPGGRFSKDTPGVRELGEALAAQGHQALIWDRPNCGESDVRFTGSSESAMQADILAGLLTQLGMTPAVVVGGSGGSRVSLLTVTRHPEVAEGLSMWWISGGTYCLMSLGVHYCGGSIAAAWTGGMEAVAALPEWDEVISRNPGNRQRILDQDRSTFIETFDRWMLTYCPCGDELVPGVPDDEARNLQTPTLVFRSGESDAHHTRKTSEDLASLLPQATLVEPPWPDTEWNDRGRAREAGNGGLFDNWPALAPSLLDWAATSLPSR